MPISVNFGLYSPFKILQSLLSFVRKEKKRTGEDFSHENENLLSLLL
jgi:hypothetical protein